MQLFFADTLDLDLCTLTPTDSHHCVKVMRMRAGDAVRVTDGRGLLCDGHITIADSNACQVAIDVRHEAYGLRQWRLHIAVAPTKNADRIEWFVEKAVEVGVDTVTLLVCDHSERTTLKMERLEKIVGSAMKQSIKAYRPQLHNAVAMRDFVEAYSRDGSCKLICHCDGDRQTLGGCYTPGRDALVLIGPEGDFSHEEIAAALQAGFVPVTLGESRLRTETAALYATVALNLMNT
ncbi:MAG: 16S rRNA (uracil1498-N3)-methyltransferase [bacterium P3]|nr:MAG: 16S rRNA (uracil1498-N3)-methyltransferase [bacterium P3]KWW40518.1 MAG: 16S rRNA (uracil1498-N3)-methyltransferase [bacterium F083]